MNDHRFIASPDAGVALPVLGILILVVWIVGNLISSGVRTAIRRRREFRLTQQRGFEVKTTTPGQPPKPPGSETQQQSE